MALVTEGAEVSGIVLFTLIDPVVGVIAVTVNGTALEVGAQGLNVWGLATTTGKLPVIKSKNAGIVVVNLVALIKVVDKGLPLNSISDPTPGGPGIKLVPFTVKGRPGPPED